MTSLRFFDDPTQTEINLPIDEIDSLTEASGYTVIRLTNGNCYLAKTPCFSTLKRRYDTLKHQQKAPPMKFRQFLQLIADPDGFIPTPRFRKVIHKNPRNTAREEAIAAKILEEANPRENISGHYPWGPEQNMALQQLWIHPQRQGIEWREVPVKDAQELYSVVSTEHGDLPVPNAVKEPETIRGDFEARLKEILGEDYTNDE